MSCHRITFSTPGALARLRARNKNIFNRLKAFIQSAHDNSTSKEGKKALNKVLKSFDKALDASRGGVLLSDFRDDEEKENTEQEHGVGDERYSLIEIVGESGTNYGIGVYLDSNLLTNLTDEERVKMVKEYVKELGGSVFTAYDDNDKAVEVHIVDSNVKFKNKNNKRVFAANDLVGYLNNKVKQEAIALVDELVITSSYVGPEPATHPHDWIDNNGKNDWDLWTTYIQDRDDIIWEAKLRIANSVNGEKILYDIFPIKKVERSGTSDTSATTNSIPQNSGNVNTNSANSSQASSQNSNNNGRNSRVVPYGKPKELWRKKDFIEFVQKRKTQAKIPTELQTLRRGFLLFK